MTAYAAAFRISAGVVCVVLIDLVVLAGTVFGKTADYWVGSIACAACVALAMKMRDPDRLTSSRDASWLHNHHADRDLDDD